MMGSERRDVISVLTHDHREVEELFGELETTEQDDGLVRRELIDEVIIELVRHSVAEQTCLYPATRWKLPGGGDIVDKSIAGHAQVEMTLKALENTDADTEEFSRLLAKLMSEVRLHIRDEEEHLFPAVAEHLSPPELIELGDEVRAVADRLPARPHPLTPDRPPLNRLFATGAGLVDGVRAHLSGRGSTDGAGAVRTHSPSRR